LPRRKSAALRKSAELHMNPKTRRAYDKGSFVRHFLGKMGTQLLAHSTSSEHSSTQQLLGNTQVWFALAACL
jgi:hypothetical protein